LQGKTTGGLAHFLGTLILLASLGLPGQADPSDHARALARLGPPAGKLLHGVYPGGASGEENDITPALIGAYERAVGQPVSFVMFSHNWYQGRAFPSATARMIARRGATPYVRLMMRSDIEIDHGEPVYTLARIAGGAFDADLAAWGRGARALGGAVIAEFGTEVNGSWFSWNGQWNGRAQGAALFVAAYRRIIDVTRAAGADNVIWVFHVSSSDDPAAGWNLMERYYPGDTYIDWLGVSVYSMQAPDETDRTSFPAAFNGAYRRLTAMAPGKPVIVAEFGTDVRNPREPAAAWADQALGQMLSRRWPRLAGFSWWNETWENDGAPAHDTDLRVQADPALAAIFRTRLARARLHIP